MEINAPSTENTVEDLEETENKGTTWLSLLVIYPKEIGVSKRHLYPPGYYSIVHETWEMESTKTSQTAEYYSVIKKGTILLTEAARWNWLP